MATTEDAPPRTAAEIREDLKDEIMRREDELQELRQRERELSWMKNAVKILEALPD